LLQQKYQTLNPERATVQENKLNKINEGYSNLNKKMDAMSNELFKMQKRDKSKLKETIEPKNVKFDFE
tara:strand:+ start:1380 stop:1583 length:204 start_codon:yes stop_codon:yes gene_type:complete